MIGTKIGSRIINDMGTNGKYVTHKQLEEIIENRLVTKKEFGEFKNTIDKRFTNIETNMVTQKEFNELNSKLNSKLDLIISRQ
jgi:hypothetical protein